MSRAKIFLKKDKDYPISLSHPWVFSGAISRLVGSAKEGDLVDVYSAEQGYLGCGHFGEQSIAIRMLSLSRIENFEEFLALSIKRALSLRDALPLNSDAYRLVNAEGDFLSGLVVDRYTSSLVIEIHSSGMQQHSQFIAKTLEGLCPEAENILIRYKQSGSYEVFKGSLDSLQNCSISENGIKFFVDTVFGQKTGFFLDQRDNRALLADYSQDRRVLNLFSFSGGFSLSALKAGASEVCSVDASRSALSLLERNLAANDLRHVKHQSLCLDCFDYLTKDCPSDFYQTIILDPPALIKRKADFKAGMRAYHALNRLALLRIASSGFLFTFSCSQFFSLQDLIEVVARAGAEAKRSVRIIRQLGPAPCHPVLPAHFEGHYLKGLLLYVD